MAVLVDWQIRNLCSGEAGPPMISPFVPEKISTLGPSYGLSSCGYDCSLSNQYWVPKAHGEPIDVAALKRSDLSALFDCYEGDDFVLLPGMFMLAATRERFQMPRNLLGRCVGKSTLRRLGIINDLTPLEPGWCGDLVVELTGSFPRPVRLRAGMGVCAIVFETFHEGSFPDKDYAQAGGKYQNQNGIVPAR